MKIGIEVEVENCDSDPDGVIKDTKTGVEWSVSTDGSLRNIGREFISNPIDGFNSAVSSFNNLIDQLDTMGVDYNKRCGIHFHFEVCKLSDFRRRVIVTNYLMLEKMIFSRIGRDRDMSNFCLPLLNNDGDLRVLLQIFNKASIDWGRYHKYSALNLAPMGTLGTFEFRALPSSN
jgi:hypothetical protein